MSIFPNRSTLRILTPTAPSRARGKPMRWWFFSALFLLASCGHATAYVWPWETTLSLPDPTHAPPTALRLYVVGDGGWPGHVHDTVFATIRMMLGQTQTPGTVLMTGDLFAPAGLPAQCSAARGQVDALYLNAVPDLPFFVVPGNKDHGDRLTGTDTGLAGRDAFFDCSWQHDVTTVVGWTSAGCPCSDRWHDPAGTLSTGAQPLLRGAPGQPEIELVTYDSQAALTDPAGVAADLDRALTEVPQGARVIVMAHHPLRSTGPRSREIITPQDFNSTPYGLYASRISSVIAAHESQIALLVFGHNHASQFLPGSPPELISGSASESFPVVGAVSAVSADADAPGFATIDLLKGGGMVVTLIGSGSPEVFHVP
jgi:hypothetical protein